MDTSASAFSSASFSIPPDQLRFQIGLADAPLLLDVRPENRFSSSALLIAGAWRCAPHDVTAFAAQQLAMAPFRPIVVYCAFGHQVSTTAVETLRSVGLQAFKLAGGIEGGEDGVDAALDIATWRTHPLPTIRKRTDLGVTGVAPSRWITRARPKIDRIACPWLIRRFIDSRAMFSYVPASQLFDEAERLVAVPFDIPGAPISHVGELCSFDALLRAFELREPALDRLARIIRGADTDCLNLAPQSAGLLALSLGLSQAYSDDDAMLEAAMPMYDALYRWCQSLAQASWQGRSPESHNWPQEKQGELS